MRNPILVCVLAAAGLLGCGSATTPGGISIGGHWSVKITNLNAGAHVCNGTFGADFAQSFNSFNGTYSSSSVTCVTNGVSVVIGQASGNITGGSVNGQSIQFALDNTDNTFTGTVNESQMSGATAWTHDFGDGAGPVALSGAWTATKQ